MRILEIVNPGVVAGPPVVAPQKICPISKSLETEGYHIGKRVFADVIKYLEIIQADLNPMTGALRRVKQRELRQTEEEAAV